MLLHSPRAIHHTLNGCKDSNMPAAIDTYHAGSQVLPLLLHILLHRRAYWARAAIALLVVLQQLP
jgi:hypothetical protein